MTTEQIIKSWQATRKRLYDKRAKLGMNVDSWSDEYRGVNNKWFTNKDLENISYRTINYWDEKGYLTGERKSASKWRKFDFFQLIWIQLLDKCRQMGVSIETVVPSIFESYGYIQELSEEELKTIVNELPKPLEKEFKDMYNNPLNFQSTFRFWVSYSIFLKEEVSIRYYADGVSQTVVKGDANAADYPCNSRSYISLSINEVVQDFLEQKSIEVIGNAEILSQNELEIIRHLRNNEITSINILKENGEPIRLEAKSVIQVTEVNKRIYECITRGYTKIEFVTNGGKTATLQRTKNIKLR